MILMRKQPTAKKFCPSENDRWSGAGFPLLVLGMGLPADSRGANKFAEAVVASPARPASQTSRFVPPLSSALSPKKC